MSKKLELTRRRVLAGIGTVGAAGAAAGLGTSAYFNDSETFEDNTITAGTLDLTVTASGTADQGGMGPIDGEFYDASSEGDGDGGAVGVGFEITDLKPGDSYDICWCLSNDGNPAAVRAFIPSETISHGNNSSESDAADLPGVDSVDDFKTPLDSDMVTVENNIYAGCGEDLGAEPLHGPIGYDGVGNDAPYGGGLGEWVTSLADTDHTSQDGVPVGSHDGGGHKTDNNLDTGTADYILVGTGENADYESVSYCITIDVSEDAGNELQGATASFDVQFLAEQIRHNSHPFDHMATRPAGDLTSWS